MAVITLSVPDELVAQYGKYDKNPASAMGEQLKKFQFHDPKERVVVLPKVVRQALEEMIGKPIEDPFKVVEWVKSLITAGVSGADVTLTESQLARVKSMAGFWKKEPKEMLEVLVKQAVDQRLGR